jgi:hypothetical protein
MSLNAEVYLHQARTPLIRFVRCIRAPEGLKPSQTCLPDREVVFWTLRSDGSVCRLGYVRLDIPRDGLGEYEPDPAYPKATAGDPLVKLKQSQLPIRDETVPEIVCLDEILQREPVRKHWIKWHAERAEQRRLDKVRANAEHAAKVREQQALAGIVVRPKAKPKRSWFDRLLNRGRP